MWISELDTATASFGELAWHRVVLAAIVVLVFVIFRPVVLSIIYYIFYEPLSRVEEGNPPVMEVKESVEVEDLDMDDKNMLPRLDGQKFLPARSVEHG